MKRAILQAALWLISFGVGAEARAELTLLGSFDPVSAASLCGLAFDPDPDEVWVHQCSGTNVQRYSSAGAFLSSVNRPGEAANDVDVEIAPTGLVLNATALPKGSLLFVNGETGVAEIYAVNKTTGAILATLTAAFGSSHVVGGSFHPDLARFFLVQDNVPPGILANRIAGIDASTGTQLGTFSMVGTFNVSFGDVEVCASTGNLLVASSVESRLGEFTPAGVFVQSHALPPGVTGLSGIGIDDAAGEIWVSGTGGLVWHLGGTACPAAAEEVPALPALAPLALALLLIASASVALRCRRAVA